MCVPILNSVIVSIHIPLFLPSQRDCCGINSVEDWRNSTGDFDGALFPDSCCLVPMCNTFNATNDDDVRSEGCRDAVVDFLDEQLLIVAVLAITFIVGEVRVAVNRCSQAGKA